MKLGKFKKKSNSEAVGKKGAPWKLNGPSGRQSKKNMTLWALVGTTVILIGWVYMMGRKAEDTVAVAMLATPVYKNQVITENMLKPYEMLRGEFEKYAVVDSDGAKKRRILTWDEAGMIVGSFAAYPLKSNTYAEYRDFIKSRVDNSDNVLYSFPGKVLVPLEIPLGELQAFKTFLQPGDRINVAAISSKKETIVEDDGFGGSSKAQIDVLTTEPVFNDIVIADLLNNNGESILDIYAAYNDKAVWEQAQLDASPAFRESVEPKSLLIALTPEELDTYYYFISKGNVEFKASLPQRMD